MPTARFICESGNMLKRIVFNRPWIHCRDRMRSAPVIARAIKLRLFRFRPFVQNLFNPSRYDGQRQPPKKVIVRWR